MAHDSPKRYDASERKLQHLQVLGAHPIGLAFAALLTVAAGLLAFVIMVIFGWRNVGDLLASALTATDVSAAALPVHLGRALEVAAVPLALVALAVLAGRVSANWFQSGFAARWPWSSRSQASGYSVPRTGPADIAVGGLLAAVLVVAAAITFVEILRNLALFDGCEPGILANACTGPALTVFLPAAVAVALLDLVWARYSYHAGARMTEQEMRREQEETGVKWLTLWRRKNRRRYGGSR